MTQQAKKIAYLILKVRNNGLFKDDWNTHRIYEDKKEAKKECKIKNEKAKSIHYIIKPVPFVKENRSFY